MVKYNANWEIMNTYKNLQIVQSQFFSDNLIFVYIQSNSIIYSDLLPTNTNEYLFGYIWLFVIFGQIFEGNFKLFTIT